MTIVELDIYVFNKYVNVFFVIVVVVVVAFVHVRHMLNL